MKHQPIVLTLFIVLLSSIALNSYSAPGKYDPPTNRSITMLAKKLAKLSADYKASRQLSYDTSHFCAGVFQAEFSPVNAYEFINAFNSYVLDKLYYSDPAYYPNFTGDYTWSYNRVYFEIVYFGSINQTANFPVWAEEAIQKIYKETGFPLQYTIIANICSCQ